MVDPDPVGLDHQVRYTNLFTQRCAHMQRILLSTLVHAGVLKGFEAEYKLPLVNKLTAEEPVVLDEPDELDDPLEDVAGLDSDVGVQGIVEEVDEEIADLAALKANKSATTQALFYLASLGENVDKSKSTVADDVLLDDLDDEDDNLLDDSKDEGIFADAGVGGDKTILKYVHSLFKAACLTLQPTILDSSRIICIIFRESISLTKIHD